jgi:hypothetical protein
MAFPAYRTLMAHLLFHVKSAFLQSALVLFPRMLLHISKVCKLGPCEGGGFVRCGLQGFQEPGIKPAREGVSLFLRKRSVCLVKTAGIERATVAV